MAVEKAVEKVVQKVVVMVVMSAVEMGSWKVALTVKHLAAEKGCKTDSTKVERRDCIWAVSTAVWRAELKEVNKVASTAVK